MESELSELMNEEIEESFQDDDLKSCLNLNEFKSIPVRSQKSLNINNTQSQVDKIVSTIASLSSQDQVNIQQIINSEDDIQKIKKIKELSQKNKQLYVAYESAKSKKTQLETELLQLNEQNDAFKSQISKKAINPNDVLQEYLLQNQQLEQEFSYLDYILKDEYGDKYNLDQIIQDIQGYKTRQYKIDQFKKQLKEIKPQQFSNKQCNKENFEFYKKENEQLNKQVKSQNQKKIESDQELKEVKKNLEKNIAGKTIKRRGIY